MNGTNEHEGLKLPPPPWVYTEDTKEEMFSIHTEGCDPVDCDNRFIVCGIWYQSSGREHGKAIADFIVSLREQLAKERALIKRFVDSMALLEVELLKERALNNDLKQEITYLKVTGSLLVDNDGEADVANKLYQAQVELGKERALRKELVQSLENLFVFHQRVRFPYELSYEKAIMNSVESILQKSKSLDEKK